MSQRLAATVCGLAFGLALVTIVWGIIGVIGAQLNRVAF
jgi:hypothetical protein